MALNQNLKRLPSFSFRWVQTAYYPFSRSFSSNPKQTPQILISGTGINGLTLAMLLRNNGLSCEVVGKYSMDATSLHKMGSVLYPPALSVFKGLGLYPPIKGQGSTLHNHVIFHVDKRKRTETINFEEINPEFLPVSISKATLHKILANAFYISQIPNHRCYVSSFHQSEFVPGVIVHFSDHRNSLHYDVLVDTDEVNHNVRNRLVDPKIFYHPFYSLSCVVKSIDGYNNLNDSVEICAVKSRVLITPTDNSGFVVTAYLNAEQPTQQFKPTIKPIEDLLTHLEKISFGYPLDNVIQSIRKEGIKNCHASYPKEWRPASLVKGYVAMLGDCSYSFPPLYGIEDTLGIEDAGALATYTKIGTQIDQLQNFLGIYSEERLGRLVALSKESGEVHKSGQNEEKPPESAWSRLFNFRRPQSSRAPLFQLLSKEEYDRSSHQPPTIETQSQVNQ